MNSDAQTAAVTALRSGALVALPTETVYGLAADAGNPRAVARIYSVKGRPADHPLILHIASATALDRWAVGIPDWAHALVARAWPGPLTVVLPRSPAVGDWVTGGQNTVAVRVPDHPLALAVLRGFGDAVAAPSANRFGQVSPTSAEHVRRDLGDLLEPRDVILDGGPCRVGVESTIVSALGTQPVVLRPGAYSAADIERLSGVPVAAIAPSDAPRVSGSLASHYAPRAQVHLSGDPAPGDGLIAMVGVPTPPGVVRLIAPATTVDYARGVYGALREADALALAAVYAVPPTGDEGEAVAVRDRLHRAAAQRPTQP